jgi:hypothetical protein
MAVRQPRARGRPPDNAEAPPISQEGTSNGVRLQTDRYQDDATATDWLHDPRLCATCSMGTMWDPGLRDALELRAWLAGRRRVCDMAEVA